MADNLIYNVKKFIDLIKGSNNSDDSKNNCLNKVKAKYDEKNKEKACLDTKDKLKDSNYQEAIEKSKIISDLLTHTNNNIDKEKDHSEIASWIDSLPIFADILDKTGLKGSAQIVLEAHYGSSERADIVIVGTKKTKNINDQSEDKVVHVMLIIENKRWSDLKNNYPAPAVIDSCLVDVCHGGHLVLHPCMQVERYRFIMENTNGYIQKNNFEVYTAVFMQNVIKDDIIDRVSLFDERYLEIKDKDGKNIFEKNPVFIESGKYSGISGIKQNIINKTKADTDLDYNLIKYIKEIFNVESSNEGKEKKLSNLAEDIYESDLEYSGKYQEAIGSIFGNRENLLELLNEQQLLDEQQHAIFDEIKSDFEEYYDEFQKESPNKSEIDNKKIVYIIEGSTGTGKSFLALALLSYLYQPNNTTIGEKSYYTARLFMKNLDPRKFYKEFYGRNKKDVKEALNVAIKFGSIQDLEDIKYGCLICDETHRMQKYVGKKENQKDRINLIIENSYISVFFYDKKQSVSVDDYITKERIYKYIRDNKIKRTIVVKEYLLTYQHRIMNDGNYLKNDAGFLDLINRLLYPRENTDKGVLKNKKVIKKNNAYEVKLVKTPEDLKNIIIEKNSVKILDELNGMNRPSRMLAGKGSTEIIENEIAVDWNWKKDDNTEMLTIGPLGNSNILFSWDKHYDAKDKESFFLDCESVRRVGCIDCSQGLDFEYVGVIIAPDLKYEGKKVKVNLKGHRLFDTDLSGQMKKSFIDRQIAYGKIIYNSINSEEYSEEKRDCFKDIWEEFNGVPNDYMYKALGERLQEIIIRNTYYVLLSRGTRGCYIYCCNKDLENHLKREEGIPYLDLKYIGDKKKKILHCNRCQCAPKDAGGIEIFKSIKDVDDKYEPCTVCKPFFSYIGDKKEKIFHYSWCKDAPKEPDKIIKFKNIEKAKSRNYKPCNTCKPAVTYLGNKNSNKIHYDWCRHAPKEPDKIIEFKNIEEARSRGYKPCNTCKPYRKSSD